MLVEDLAVNGGLEVLPGAQEVVFFFAGGVSGRMSLLSIKGVVDRVDVRMVLEAMPNHRYAEAVNLLVLRGYEVKEVAELWHTNVSNVYNIRHRAINQFRECYLSSNHGKRIG